MPKLIDHIDPVIAAKNAARCKKHGIILPTIRQQMHPETISEDIKAKLKPIGLWDVNPLNLFRITWKNDITTGLFGQPNFIEIPSEITGVKAASSAWWVNISPPVPTKWELPMAALPLAW